MQWRAPYLPQGILREGLPVDFFFRIRRDDFLGLLPGDDLVVGPLCIGIKTRISADPIAFFIHKKLFNADEAVPLHAVEFIVVPTAAAQHAAFAEGIEDEVEGGGVEAAATGAATPAPSPARQAMDFSRSIFTEGSDATPPAEDTPAARGRFRQRCEVIANTYLLSRRESEVMYYLARGYKSSHIQQQLYISEGTAKTHIRHIYRKLNIHSQQDLIHLIDEVEL